MTRTVFRILNTPVRINSATLRSLRVTTNGNRIVVVMMVSSAVRASNRTPMVAIEVERMSTTVDAMKFSVARRVLVGTRRRVVMAWHAMRSGVSGILVRGSSIE